MSDAPNERNERAASPRVGEPSRVLERLVVEAREDLAPTIDDARWRALEEGILARIAAEEPGKLDVEHRAVPAWRGRAVRIGAVALAAAAAFVLVPKKDAATPHHRASQASTTDSSGGSLRATEGVGEVRIGGVRASAGHPLRAGDVIEVEAARAVLERPREIAWLLERADGHAAEGHSADGTSANVGAIAGVKARARVTAAGETLVLALEEGAIEAQVTPVPSGEAFAVDVVDGSKAVRVAVHGTHLRVSRAGSKVVVDLTEGVIAIGAPPREGTTRGTTVHAPAHVELDVADVEHTLNIDRAPAAVRAAIPLSPFASPPQGTGFVEGPAPARAPSHDLTSSAGSPNTTPVARSHLQPNPADERSPHARAAASPRDAIAAAVRGCAIARDRPANVRVTVTSSLKLKIAPGGVVETALFQPPLLPEIQTCAATTIYAVRFDAGSERTVTIPLQFSY